MIDREFIKTQTLKSKEGHEGFGNCKGRKNFIESVKRMYECVGADVWWKRLGREAEKRMVLDASCDPFRSGEGVRIQMK